MNGRKRVYWWGKTCGAEIDNNRGEPEAGAWMTRGDIGRIFGLVPQRIKQIELGALRKLRRIPKGEARNGR